jgi:hypothetical protein
MQFVTSRFLQIEGELGCFLFDTFECNSTCTYIKAKMVSVRLSGQKLGSAWKILPVTAPFTCSCDLIVQHVRTQSLASVISAKRLMVMIVVMGSSANMVSVCLCGQKLGSAWKILPVTARSLWSWSVLDGKIG